MKPIIISILALFIFSNTITAQTYTLTTESAQIIWKGYGEVGNYTQSGTIDPSEGSIKVVDNQIVSGQVVIDMHTLSHEDRSLKKHLKAKDFFHCKKYPTASLKIISQDQNILFTKIMIKGVEREVSFPIVSEQVDDKVLVQGTINIDRTIFGIKYNSSSYFQDLGNYAIKNEFDLLFNFTFTIE